MKDENNFTRLLILLLLAVTICGGMFYLPEKILDFEVKRVDLLSDLRENKAATSLMDSLRAQLEMPDTTELITPDTVFREEVITPEILAERDSLYALFNSVGSDSTLIPLEDYSAGHVGLKRFYKALRAAAEDGGTVRIGVLGDSFIEGDIMVADLRNEMQKRFGGRGVGFVPIASVAAMFRTTVVAKESGWTTYSLLKDKNVGFTLPGTVFQPAEENAFVSMELKGFYQTLSDVSSVEFIYSSDKDYAATFEADGDTMHITLPYSEKIRTFEFDRDTIRKVSFAFNDASGLKALGIVMEDKHGVSVDNFSLRGNSGLPLANLSTELCEQLNEVRPYDLLILQYGLNVANDSTLNYNWYAAKMGEAVDRLRMAFPETDILLLGVSDRSTQVDGEFETMPAVLSLLHSQRKLAKQKGLVFWNTFAAMGGENSMPRFVENNWAAKDYTHLSFRGGREISRALIKAILREKDFYDKID